MEPKTRPSQCLPRTLAVVVAIVAAAGFPGFAAPDVAGQEAGAPRMVDETQLHWAAGFNAVQAVRALIDRGMDVDAEDSTGRTPLHWAAAADAVEAIRVLLAAGASPMADAAGGSVLREAAAANAAGAIEALLSSAAVRDVMPLHVAAATDDVRLARALVASGVDVEARNDAGKTALVVAAAADAAGVIHVLVVNGVDLQILDARCATSRCIWRRGPTRATPCPSCWGTARPATY